MVFKRLTHTHQIWDQISLNILSMTGFQRMPRDPLGPVEVEVAWGAAPGGVVTLPTIEARPETRC